MDFEEEFELEHLLFTQRRCRSCGKIKELVSDFYRTRKGRATPSAYSYECKVCTVNRIIKSRKHDAMRWEYPDW
tara:strand:+ start:211 stop:432 length:222 start_codon:yes stop_codon:yes gene_type:complete